MNEIKRSLPSDTFTHAEKRHRPALLNAVLHLPFEMRKRLEDMAHSKIKTGSIVPLREEFALMGDIVEVRDCKSTSYLFPNVRSYTRYQAIPVSTLALSRA